MKGLTLVGEWLSLVEHLVRDQGVGGSNPLSPTNLFKHLNCVSGFSVSIAVVEFVGNCVPAWRALHVRADQASHVVVGKGVRGEGGPLLKKREKWRTRRERGFFME